MGGNIAEVSAAVLDERCSPKCLERNCICFLQQVGESAMENNLFSFEQRELENNYFLLVRTHSHLCLQKRARVPRVRVRVGAIHIFKMKTILRIKKCL